MRIAGTRRQHWSLREAPKANRRPEASARHLSRGGPPAKPAGFALGGPVRDREKTDWVTWLTSRLWLVSRPRGPVICLAGLRRHRREHSWRWSTDRRRVRGGACPMIPPIGPGVKPITRRSCRRPLPQHEAGLNYGFGLSVRHRSLKTNRKASDHFELSLPLGLEREEGSQRPISFSIRRHQHKTDINVAFRPRSALRATAENPELRDRVVSLGPSGKDRLNAVRQVEWSHHAEP